MWPPLEPQWPSLEPHVAILGAPMALPGATLALLGAPMALLGASLALLAAPMASALALKCAKCPPGEPPVRTRISRPVGTFRGYNNNKSVPTGRGIRARPRRPPAGTWGTWGLTSKGGGVSQGGTWVSKRAIVAPRRANEAPSSASDQEMREHPFPSYSEPRPKQPQKKCPKM